MQGHIIVCGDDALAMRIIDELNNAEISVVPLESSDGLAAAGVTTADAIICAANDDAVNLELALLARQSNPQVRVVARLANTVLREAVADGNGRGAILDVAELAAPSVVEALLGRTTHAIPVAGVDFVVSGAAAPRDGTLREIYGDLSPVAIIRGENSDSPGTVIRCPSRDERVSEGDWTTMTGTADELTQQGIVVGEPIPATPHKRSLGSRIVDAARAFHTDVNPMFYRAAGASLGLLLASTVILRFYYDFPGMDWMDAVYFSAETIATVGYGDFNFLNQPLWLRLWGVFMMLGGVATTAIVVAFVADVLLSRRFSQAASLQKARHMRRHIVLVGLGSFGVRVGGVLKAAGHDVVAIEIDENNRYVPEAVALGVPVIVGDATVRQTLEAARVEDARAVAVLTQDDMVNIETGIVVRDLLGPRPEPGSSQGTRRPIVLRIYDEALGDAVGKRFGFGHVRSTVDLAAPWFIGAALGLDVLGTFSVGQRSFMVGGVRVRPGSELDGIRMADVSLGQRVIAIARDGVPVRLHPRRDIQLSAGDTAYLVGPYRELLETLRKGQRAAQPDRVGRARKTG